MRIIDFSDGFTSESAPTVTPITRANLASGTAYRILANNSSGVMSENAALTANRPVISDGNGQLTTEATLAVSRGGTGLASGTSGGLLYYSGTGTIASSGAYTAGRVLYGAGAGAAPTSSSAFSYASSVLTVAGVGAVSPGTTVIRVNDTAGASATPYSGIDFTSTGNAGKAAIMQKVAAGGTTAGISLFAGGATPTEALAISGSDQSATFTGKVYASGNVGVGTTSPNIRGFDKATTINAASITNGVALELGNNGASWGEVWATTTAMAVNAYANIPLIFRTNNTLALTLDTSQNATFSGVVGIGTAPASGYSVKGSARATFNSMTIGEDGDLGTGTKIENSNGIEFRPASSGGSAVHITTGKILQVNGSSLDASLARINYGGTSASIANNGTKTYAFAAGTCGLLLVSNATNSQAAVFMVSGGTGATSIVEIADPSGNFTTTAANASTNNVYQSVNGTITVENKTGSTCNYKLSFIQIN